MTKDCTLPSKKARGSVLEQTTKGKKITLQKALTKKLDKKKKDIWANRQRKKKKAK